MPKTCECQCGGEPRPTDIEVGVRTATGNVVLLGSYTHGHKYAQPTGGDEWVARHPGGQWSALVPVAAEAMG